jgi:Flp pilus assembly protein TadB
MVIMAAPVAFVALTGASDPEAWTFLTGTPIGLACCASGLLLALAGGMWMVRIAGRPT